MANTKELELIISAQTAQAEAGLANIRARFAELTPATDQAAAALKRASAALDVKPMSLVGNEIRTLRGHYETLRSSGKLSQSELAAAAANLSLKTAQLRQESTSHFNVQQKGASIISGLAAKVAAVAAAYLSWRTVTAVVGGVVDATREAEQSQFNLTASIQAASREFKNTGSLEHWQNKTRELSAALKVYSEADVANAISRTVDMTKRLGLSAEQMETVISRTADLSAGKTDLQGGIERVTAALRGEAEASEFLGLTLNETYVKSWHEAHNAHGTAWKDLTDLEKTQIRYNILLEQSDPLQGRAAASAGTLSGAMAMVKSEMANAIANNRDLNEAMVRIADVIRANADQLGALAATLATTIGTVIQFVAEHKELILTLAGAGGVVFAVNAVSGALSGVVGAIQLFRGARLAAAAAEGATALSGMGSAAGLAKGGMVGLTAAVGLFTGSKIAELIATIHQWRQAADEAEQASQRLLKTTAENVKKFESWKDVKLPGLDGANVETLEKYREELSKTSAYWTALHADLSERSEAHDFLGNLTDDAEAAAKQLPAVSARLREVKADLGEVSTALRAAQGETDRTAQSTRDLGAAAAAATAEQTALTRAIELQDQAEAALRLQVIELGAAYEAASRRAVAAEAEGSAAHNQAVYAKLQAEDAYHAAVEALRNVEAGNQTSRLAGAEAALRQSLIAQLAGIDAAMTAEKISRDQATAAKAQAEQSHAKAILALRDAVVTESAKLYGTDSEQYKAAVAAKKAAEESLKKAIEGTQTATQNATAAAQTGKTATDNLTVSMVVMGETGAAAGSQAAEGVRQVETAARSSEEAVKKLDAALASAAQKTSQAGSSGSSTAVVSSGSGSDSSPGTSTGPGSTQIYNSVAGWFYAQIDEITRQIDALKSAEELNAYQSENRDWIWEKKLEINSFERALGQYMEDYLFQAMNKMYQRDEIDAAWDKQQAGQPLDLREKATLQQDILDTTGIMVALNDIAAYGRAAEESGASSADAVASVAASMGNTQTAAATVESAMTTVSAAMDAAAAMVDGAVSRAATVFDNVATAVATPDAVATTVEVRFIAPTGDAVSGRFSAADADALLGVLAAAGAVTA